MTSTIHHRTAYAGPERVGRPAPRQRRIAGLLALGAIAALAAGCGPTDAQESPSPTDPAGVEAGTSDSGGATDGGAAGGGASDGGATGPSAAPGGATGSWAGTVSTERFSPSADGSYLTMENLHGEWAAHEMTAAQLEQTEFLGSFGATCEGTAVLDGSAAECTFTGEDGAEHRVQVRLVPTAWDNTALLYGVDAAEGDLLEVAPGAELGFQPAFTEDVGAVTDQDLSDIALSAVMLQWASDGELPHGLDIDCTVSDAGEHGTCEVTGTPDGGGDGTWYATAQRGYPGHTAAYVFTRLPQA